MWPFNQPRTKYMRKVTLKDGQEFTGEDWVDIFVGPSGVRVIMDEATWETILYPHHRILETRTWKERV